METKTRAAKKTNVESAQAIEDLLTYAFEESDGGRIPFNITLLQMKKGMKLSNKVIQYLYDAGLLVRVKNRNLTEYPNNVPPSPGVGAETYLKYNNLNRKVRIPQSQPHKHLFMRSHSIKMVDNMIGELQKYRSALAMEMSESDLLALIGTL